MDLKNTSNGDYLVDVQNGTLRFTPDGRRRLTTVCRMVGERIESIRTVDDLERVFARHPDFLREHYFNCRAPGSDGEALAHLITGNLRKMAEAFLHRDSEATVQSEPAGARM